MRGIRHAEAVHDARRGRIAHVHGEEPIVRIRAKGRPAGHADGPVVVVPRLEPGKIHTPDVPRPRRIVQCEDIESPTRTDRRVPCGLFAGSYLDEEKTKEAWHDGMYHTGDTPSTGTTKRPPCASVT